MSTTDITARFPIGSKVTLTDRQCIPAVEGEVFTVTGYLGGVSLVLQGAEEAGWLSSPNKAVPFVEDGYGDLTLTLPRFSVENLAMGRTSFTAQEAAKRALEPTEPAEVSITVPTRSAKNLARGNYSPAAVLAARGALADAGVIL